ncbi:MAG TPA: endonuclease [Gammaproteobacteria bacterium]|nr:endonuclease [Gammaproteobacteria bacterium]
MTFDAHALADVLRALSATYGPQHWWPAESPFEIAAGAVLVQRTAWHNAALAVDAMKRRGLLDPAALAEVEPKLLARVIRPAGFAAAKADYLRNVAAWFRDNGGVEGLRERRTETLRADLLAVRGIGPETADSILLYLFDRPVWIVDAYSRRVLERLTGFDHDARRQRMLLGPWIDSGRLRDLQELHALFVEHGKRHCRVQARCAGCPLRATCLHA